MSQSPPTTLGKYQIIREIARSNDIVYEAWDPVMSRRVAVKELSVPGGSSDKQRDERLQRFHREARAAGSLVHPNIVTIYEVSEEGGRHFIAMEYLDGRNLRQELDSAGSLSPIRAVEIAIEVLKGLSFSHGKGVVHRDIKPDNIQLLDGGAVKITDFGIARLTFEPNLTMDGQVFGTPSYMSPEQIHGREIDARSDIFSVGVILYEMVAGIKPFTGDSVVSITYSIMNTQPTQPPQASHSLWMAISRALDKSPQLRPGSTDEMRGMLESVLHEMKSGSVVQAPMSPQNWGAPPQIIHGPPPVLFAPAPSPPTHVPGQVYQQPYVPGGGSIPPPPMAQGGTPYNPYGAPVQLPQGVPVYYPPPPKPPLVTPAAKMFMVKLLMTMVILATIAGLAIFLLNTATGTAESGAAPRNSAPAATGDPTALIADAMELMDRMTEAPLEANIRDDAMTAAGYWRSAAGVAGSRGDTVRSQAAIAFIRLAETRGTMGDEYGGRVAAQQATSFAIGDPELSSRARTLLTELGG